MRTVNAARYVTPLREGGSLPAIVEADDDGMLATGTAALLMPRSTKAADSRIEVLLNEPIGKISPDIYSHFVEHLGGVVYDGIWVGEKSTIPNYNGIRKSLVDNLKRLKPGVIRYPGGCFADQYDWRDGVGPRDKRPTRVMKRR